MAKGKRKRARPDEPTPPAKASPPTRTVADLTAAQVRELGTDLVRRQGNVYTILATRYGVAEADEVIFARLKNEGDAFKCEMCDTWKLLVHRDADPRGDSDVCTNCLMGEAEDE
jgi:hypothetical protein